MHIRLATPADIQEIHRVRMSVRENVLRNPASVTPADTLRMLTQDGRGWVCEADGRIVGFAVGDLVRSNVWALFVEPDYERQGIGRRLHDVMVDWMFDEGATDIWLSTDPHSRAEGFYRAAGWDYVGLEISGEARFEMTRERWLLRRS